MGSTSAFFSPDGAVCEENALWQACLDRLEQLLPRPTFEMCLRGSHGQVQTPHCLHVTLPHGYAFDMLRSRQRQNVVDAARKVLAEIGGGTWKVHWAAPSREDEERRAAEMEPAPPSPSLSTATRSSNESVAPGKASNNGRLAAPSAPVQSKGAGRATSATSLAGGSPTGSPTTNGNAESSRFTFDRLITGPTNQMAVQAARQVGDNPGRSFNPLVIYGDVGLGKTHLMLAVKNYLRAARPSTRIVYTSSETFTNELVEAFQARSVPTFRRKYRHVDLLLVDDVEFLIGKERIQEEFYHTFEELAASGRQLILTCDRPPHLLTHLQERLCSRLSSGLMADIQAPTVQMRRQILLQRAREARVHMAEEVVDFIADNFCGSVRSLEGALVRVLAYADAVGERNLNLRVTQRALQGFISVKSSRTRLLTLSDVLEKVCHYYHVEVDDLVGTRRDRRFSTPRHIAMYLAQELVRMRCREISEAFGNRDYSTVTHAIKKIAAQREQPNIKSDLTHLQAMLDQ